MPFRRALFFLIVPLLLAISASGAAVLSPEMLAEVSRAVKPLVTNGSGGRIGQGTGFFVSPDGRMLTSLHLVAGSRVVKIWDGDDFYDVVRILASDREADIALLETAYPPAMVRYLPLREEMISIGEPVAAFGYPTALETGNSIMISTGSVRSLATLGDNTLIQFTAFADAGSSGGPIIDRNGRVAGVVIGEFTLEKGIFLGLSSPSLLKLLSPYLPKTP